MRCGAWRGAPFLPEVSLSLSPLKLHPTILLMACVHMMVDGYGNILIHLN